MSSYGDFLQENQQDLENLEILENLENQANPGNRGNLIFASLNTRFKWGF